MKIVKLQGHLPLTGVAQKRTRRGRISAENTLDKILYLEPVEGLSPTIRWVEKLEDVVRKCRDDVVRLSRSVQKHEDRVI